MNCTNKYGFPQYVVDWLTFDEYDYNEGIISATTLLDPVRVYALTKRYYDQIVYDVSELIAARYGTALHASFEIAPIQNVLLQEHRLYAQIGDIKISGKPDMIQKTADITFLGMQITPKKGGVLVDIKSTSVWSYIYGDKDDHYIKQLSIYRYLSYVNGILLDDVADIFMMFTDWSKKAAREKSDYPKTRIQIKKIHLMTIDDTKAMIEGKIAELKATDKLTDDQLPKCTREDLWMADDEWAIMKKDGVKAKAVFDTEEKARNYFESNQLDDKVYCIVYRPAKAKRCPYCRVREFCSQYKELQAADMVENEVK